VRPRLRIGIRWTGVVGAAIGLATYVIVEAGLMPSTIAFTLTAIALLWCVWIIFRTAQALVKEPEREEVARASGRRKKELEREKQALLKALKELEFDHEMGKISDADYQEIGGNYRARAVRVLRQLDLAGGDVDYRSLVERDVKARTGAKPAEPAPRGKPKCAGCATENDVDAEFCKKCGKKLEAAA
jgi:hypothetical protein